MNIEASIRRFIVDELVAGRGQDEMASDEPLLDGGVVDSLGLLRLIRFLEAEFHVTVEDDEVSPEHFQTIDAIKSLIASKLLVDGQGHGH